MSNHTDTRAEHIAWCKERALAYVDRGDLQNALASMSSDVRKHPETDTAIMAALLIQQGLPFVNLDDTDGMRRFIEGFN